MLDRIDQFRPAADADMQAAIAATEAEIELFRQYSDVYGYVFYLLQKPSVELEPSR